MTDQGHAMKASLNLTYRDISLTVHGDYYPGTPNLRWEPGDWPEFIVEDVWIEDQCITAMAREAGWIAGIESAALDAAQRNQAEILRQVVRDFEPEMTE